MHMQFCGSQRPSQGPEAGVMEFAEVGRVEAKTKINNTSFSDCAHQERRAQARSNPLQGPEFTSNNALCDKLRKLDDAVKAETNYGASRSNIADARPVVPLPRQPNDLAAQQTDCHWQQRTKKNRA
eukprot:TRINITY_DN30305_c0_g1_i1.p1 TRINITY_DN30305_c0_g1~~TRINITY_DN30305_c0_g1_i1.p1  ORF type:complete len:126 (-),score=21.65 TRINITY_DN30305_c0_g1_i1:117-494(-)